MILDKENYLSDPQTVTTSTDTGLVSEHTIDLGEAKDIGVGENVWVVVIVSTTLTMDSTQGLTVQLVTDAYAALNSPTVMQTIGTFAANSAAQSVLIARIQPNSSYEQYVGLNYVVTTGNALSAGAVKAFLTTDVDVVRSYANGFDIATS